MLINIMYFSYLLYLQLQLCSSYQNLGRQNIEPSVTVSTICWTLNFVDFLRPPVRFFFFLFHHGEIHITL